MKTKTLKIGLAVLGLLLSLNTFAYDVEINGIYYNLIEKAKQAEVTSGDSRYTGEVTIPASFEYDGVTYSVTSIGNKAFYNCSGLTSITIPNSVTSIGNKAFYGCTLLNTIYSLNPIPPICFSTSTFECYSDVRDKYDVYAYATLHVPMGSEEVYSSAYEWRYFNKIKEDMESGGKVHYANLTVRQGTTGYTRQAMKAAERYTIYIGSLGENRVNAVTFNGVDVTDDVVDGYYTTPEIKGESVLSISFEASEPSYINARTLVDVRVTGNNGEITINHIDEPSDVYVYTTDGKLVNSIPSALGSTSLQVPSGQLYIVKVGERTYKLAM